MNEYRKFVFPEEIRIEEGTPAKVAKVAKVEDLLEPPGQQEAPPFSEMRVGDPPPAKVAKVAKVEGSAEGSFSALDQDSCPPGTVLHLWSTVLDCEFWIMETDAQVRLRLANGHTAYSVREVELLRGMKAQHPHDFDDRLRAMHACRDAFDATLQPPELPAASVAAPHEAATTRRPKPRDPNLGPVLPPCAACGELRHWHDHAGQRWVCWACEPPVLKAPGVPVPASLMQEPVAATAA